MMEWIISKGKVIFLLCSIIFCFFALFTLDVFAAESTRVKIQMDGHGTQEYPYLIGNVDDFENLRDVINSGNNLYGVWFALADDIDFQGQCIEPLVEYKRGMSFQGGFDGRGHSISNFTIEKKGGEASFLGRIDGVVRNLKLSGSILGDVCSSFAQEGDGTILNCISECRLDADRTAAGIVNNWNGILQNVVFQGEINAPISVGIVGSGYGSAIQTYSKDYKIGHIANADYCEKISDSNITTIVDELNMAAQQLFFTSNYGKWLNKWSYEEKIKFSEELAAFEGAGTENDPILIESVDDLEVLVSYINAGYTFDALYLYQTEDIDLKGYPWIGLWDDSVAFCGTYNGNGHTIANLDTEGRSGGLFKNFNGTIINLKLENCNTEQGYGFAGNIGPNSLILNCYFDGINSDMSLFSNLYQTEQIINCYIKGFMEPTEEELNNGLKNLVINYGIHSGELCTWLNNKGILKYGINYKDIYLVKERMYWSGDGSERSPYLISTLEDFVYLRESVYYNESFWRYWFQQTADIDFSSVRFWRAVSDESAKFVFYGNYNGNGFEIQNFNTNDESIPINRTLFGNVYGNIFNTYIVDYCVNGTGDGIIAYNLSGTGKIFNNIIEIDGGSKTFSAVAIVNNNNGCILNNIVVRPNNSFGVHLSFGCGKVNEKLGIPKVDFNQIVTKLDDEVMMKYNEGTVSTALQLKRRITNFNLLSNDKETYNLHNNILITSPKGIEFVKEMLKSNPILLMGILGLLFAVLYIVCEITRNIYNKTRIPTNILIQFAVLIGIYLAFVRAIYHLKPNVEETKIISLMHIFLVIVGCICISVIVKRVKRKGKNFIFTNDIVKEYSPIVLAQLGSAIVIMCHINTPVAYDADLYYGSFILAIQNFGFSFTGMLDSFCIASKPMHGIAMLMTIGEALEPRTARGVYICNLILLLLAQYCIYKIIRKLFYRYSPVICAIFSLCFSFSGYVLVGATYINPDFYSVVSFAIFLYCILYKYKVFAVFWGFLSICSKPNMIVTYIVFVAIFCIYELISKKIHLGKYVVYTLPVSIYLILYYGVNSLNRVGVVEGSQIDFIRTAGSRLLQYFAYGFIWIQEIFIIGALIVLLRKRKLSIFANQRNVFLFAVWMACLSQLIITIVGGSFLHLCPRYLTICAIKNVLLFAWAFEILPLKDKTIMKVASILMVLLFVQLFVTIDPTIIITTDKKTDGLYYLVFPANEQNGNDLAFYNYEYCKDTWEGSRILSVLDSKEIENMVSDSELGYKMAIQNSDVYAVYWDNERKCRTYLPNENCVRLRMDNIVDGMTSKQEVDFKNFVIVLRNSESYAIKNLLTEIKEDKYKGSFTIFEGK